jgi:hypothetical protein
VTDLTLVNRTICGIEISSNFINKSLMPFSCATNAAKTTRNKSNKSFQFILAKI